MLNVIVKGSWIPRNFFGRFQAIFSFLRMLYLSLWLYLLGEIYYDTIIVDQVTYTVPILKRCAQKILLYYHFPDGLQTARSRNPLRNWLYRPFVESFERAAMMYADKITVNSEFAANMLIHTFPGARQKTVIIYPGVDVKKLQSHSSERLSFPWPP